MDTIGGHQMAMGKALTEGAKSTLIALRSPLLTG